MPVYAITTPRRSMHYHPLAPFWGHYNHSPVRRASPSLVPSLFRGLEEDFASLDSLFNNITSKPAIRSYQPRFDVREEKDAYHLHGDVPGVDAQNLSIEFTDRNILVVSGRAVKESERGNRPEAVEEQAAIQDKGKQKAVDNTEAAADAMETEPTSRPSTPGSTSSNYHKATVEDSREEGDDFVDVAAETATATEGTAAPTPATTTAAPAEQSSNNETTQAATSQSKNNDGSYYWVSERGVGEFKRSFRFPGHVDQEGVKATLKDGLLQVVVPKAKEVGPRRIQVE